MQGATAALDDHQIPALLTLTAAARVLDVSPRHVDRLVLTSGWEYQKVGRITVVLASQLEGLAATRSLEGSVGAARRRERIPPLVSTSVAATMLGYTNPREVATLYRRGILAGRAIGRDLVFRRDAVRALARHRSGLCARRGTMRRQG